MSWAPWDANITHPERKAPRRAAGRGPAFGTKSHAQEMVIPSAPSREGIGTPFGAQGGRVDAIDGAGAARRHEAARRLRRCHTADVGQVEIAQISPGAASLPQNQPATDRARRGDDPRSEEHTSELQSLMRISYAVFCLQTTKHKQ